MLDPSPHPSLWATADKLRLARQARQEFLDRWIAAMLQRESDDLDQLVADMEIMIGDPVAANLGLGDRRFLIE